MMKLLTSILVFLLLAGCATKPQLPMPEGGETLPLSALSKETIGPSCSKQVKPTADSNMDFENTAISIHEYLMARYEASMDRRLNRWRSQWDKLRIGATEFYGTCSTVACTAVNMALSRGIPSSDIRLVSVIKRHGGPHIVAAVGPYIIDSAQFSAWHWSELPYTFVASRRISESFWRLWM